MQGVVIDTNVVISAAISDAGNPAKILRLVAAGKLRMYYSEAIFAEYAEVLSRVKFGFSLEKQAAFLDEVREIGVSVNPAASAAELPDEADRIFYEAALETGAILVSGNIRHYPKEPFVMTPAQFLVSFEPPTSP